MKYEELDFEKIKKEDCDITRYNGEHVISKTAKVLFTPCEIKEVIFNGKTYKRDHQDVDIPWLAERFLTYHYFYDEESRERVNLISFVNDFGEVEYGFSDHND